MDEHISFALVHALRLAGLDVATAQERGLEGADDAHLAQVALAERRMVLTNDTDFLRMTAEALAAQSPFPPILFWPQGKSRAIRHLVSRTLLLAVRKDYESLCSQVHFL